MFGLRDHVRGASIAALQKAFARPAEKPIYGNTPKATRSTQCPQ